MLGSVEGSGASKLMVLRKTAVVCALGNALRGSISFAGTCNFPRSLAGKPKDKNADTSKSHNNFQKQT